MSRQLVWSLADREITQIVSSPLARCVETVVLSAARGLAVETRWELEPDSDFDIMTLLVDLPPRVGLICPATIGALREADRVGRLRAEKGAIWVLERNGREFAPSLSSPRRRFRPLSVRSSGVTRESVSERVNSPPRNALG